MSVPYEEGIIDAINASAARFAEGCVNAIRGEPSISYQQLISISGEDHGFVILYAPISMHKEIRKMIEKKFGKPYDSEELRLDWSGDEPNS